MSLSNVAGSLDFFWGSIVISMIAAFILFFPLQILILFTQVNKSFLAAAPILSFDGFFSTCVCVQWKRLNFVCHNSFSVQAPFSNKWQFLLSLSLSLLLSVSHIFIAPSKFIERVMSIHRSVLLSRIPYHLNLISQLQSVFFLCSKFERKKLSIFHGMCLCLFSVIQKFEKCLLSSEELVN